MKHMSCPLLRAAPSSRAVLLTLFVLWTAFWIPRGWAHMKAESLVVQNGFGADGIQMWELFDLQMVIAYTVVRWLPGVAALGGAWWWLRRRRRAAAAEGPAAASEPERSLAA